MGAGRSDRSEAAAQPGLSTRRAPRRSGLARRRRLGSRRAGGQGHKHRPETAGRRRAHRSPTAPPRGAAGAATRRRTPRPGAGSNRHPRPGRATADLRPADARSPGPRRGAATRFQPRPDRPSPQSQSFSRSYGSGLPTSLTYIVLSTRGCSPWRPAAVIGTTRGDGPRTPPHFQGPAGARRTPPETRRSTGPQPLAPDKPIPGIPPLTKKRKLFPGPRPASAGSLALQLGPPRRTEGSASGFGNIDPIPFRPGGEAPTSRGGGRPPPLGAELPWGLGSTDPCTTAVHMEPFSATRPSRISLEYLLLPPRSAPAAAPRGLAAGASTRTAAALLLVGAYHPGGGPRSLPRRPGMGGTLSAIHFQG